MPNWKGIVGGCYTPAEFKKYVESLKMGLWRPGFIVLHNTAIPTIKDWHSVSGGDRMHGLQSYYRDVQHWSAGPHLFVADDLIWTFTPLSEPGVHSPSWNALAWGVEMVGDYGSEAFDSGPGALVQANAVYALAVLSIKGDLQSSSIRLHKEDPKTTHVCPGRNVSKEKMIAAVHAKILELKAGK